MTTSKFMDVLGSTIHYVDEGKGDPIIFLHGIPTSSYLWRNIIPSFTGQARCIAPDLIGMGQSGKPDIPYRIFDHIRYMNAFIDALDLDNITFVLHGWGSLVGFDYAMRHQDRIKALAFFESHVKPTVDWEMLSLPVQEIATLLSDPAVAEKAILQDNFFLNKVLPNGILRQLSKEETEAYCEPFAKTQDRKPLWQYSQDLPLGKGPDDVVKLISGYSEKLQASQCPKLLMYAIPGFITPIASVQWCKENLHNLQLVDLGDGLHFAQESNPKRFSESLLSWYGSL